MPRLPIAGFAGQMITTTKIHWFRVVTVAVVCGSFTFSV